MNFFCPLRASPKTQRSMLRTAAVVTELAEQGSPFVVCRVERIPEPRNQAA